ncbi:MAG: hypothetical protein ACOYMD_07710 [Paludibacter sp.]
MHKKIVLLILISLTVCGTVYSQDFTLKCGEKIVPCENGNKDHFEAVIHFPYIEIDSTKLPKTIHESARNYLFNRLGVSFYTKVYYYSSQDVNYKSKIYKFNGFPNPKLDMRTKYAIQYFFTIQDCMRYYFTIVFDKNGRVISKAQIPNFKKNIQFDKIISICDAKIISEQDKLFLGEIKNISLEYYDLINSFIWRVEKPSVKGKKPREEIHRFIILNANTGRVIKRETESWISACEGNLF